MNKLAPWFWTPTHSHPRDAWSDLFAPARATKGKAAAAWSPNVDVTETPEAYVFKLELPGLNPEDVEVTLEDKTLTIKGEKTSEERREGDTWHVVERRSGSFKRTFTFPDAVDGESVAANTEHGLLTIEVKKARETQPKRIKISS